jgi:protein-S-isoprenylcysteine O-methyltransferase Ste14
MGGGGETTRVRSPAKIDHMWGMLYTAWVASEVAILIFRRTRGRTAGCQIHDRGSLLLLWPVIIASIALGTWYAQLHSPDLLRDASQARLLSILFLAFGLAIRWMAILKLGRSFTANVTIQQRQRVEKTGVFRFVRHPSYTGLLVIFAGIGLNTRSSVGLAIVILPITLALLYRIHVEEKALSEAFGDEYQSYCRSTKRLIPGVF